MRRRLLSPAPPPHLRLSQRQHSQCCPAPTLPSHHWWSRGYSFAMRTTASTDSTALDHRRRAAVAAELRARASISASYSPRRARRRALCSREPPSPSSVVVLAAELCARACRRRRLSQPFAVALAAELRARASLPPSPTPSPASTPAIVPSPSLELTVCAAGCCRLHRRQPPPALSSPLLSVHRRHSNRDRLYPRQQCHHRYHLHR